MNHQDNSTRFAKQLGLITKKTLCCVDRDNKTPHLLLLLLVKSFLRKRAAAGRGLPSGEIRPAVGGI